MSQPRFNEYRQRFDLGAPEKDENLRVRYREALLGCEAFGFTDDQLRAATADFEQVLADLAACKQCQAEQAKTLKAKDAYDREYRVRVFDDCRSATGGGFYTVLQKAGCSYYKRPSFAVVNCPGPVLRKEEIREAWLSERQD